MNDPEIISKVAVHGWYDYLNITYSILFFTAAATSLNSGDYSVEVATISMLFIGLHGYLQSNKRGIKGHTERLHRYKGRVSLAITCWFKTPLFILGALCLSAITNGFKLEHLIGFSFQNFFYSYLYLL